MMTSQCKDRPSQRALERRKPIRHVVKSWPPLFEATISGAKTHDMRRATDRDYRVGDFLELREFDPYAQEYTGRRAVALITYVTSALYPCALSEHSLHRDFCILSIQVLKDVHP